MKTIFEETFQTESNGVPCGWHIEVNSDLRDVPAIRSAENRIELLSAGNKFIPVTPDFSDGEVHGRFSFDYPSTNGQFGLIFSFRYNFFTGRGQAFRLSHIPGTEEMLLECGTTRVNLFQSREEHRFPVKDELLCAPFDLDMSLKGNTLAVSVFGQTFRFPVEPGAGKIAVSREHFYDVLKILAFQIRTEETCKVFSEKKFTIPMPQEPTLYPLYCDVTLKDYGDCMDAELSLRGGVRETPAGEGNYHGMRADILEKPFLKILQKASQTKYTFFNDTIIGVPDGMAPAYFYRIFWKKTDWPFVRTIRFLKPEHEFNLAVGFEKYLHTTRADNMQSPSATVFTMDGTVLYSGLDLTEGKTKIEFFSQPDKEMIRRIPEKDPRYREAVEFVRNNHYFMEGETPEFTLRVTGCRMLPDSFDVVLEDAFLRPVRKLNVRTTVHEQTCGILTFKYIELKAEPLPDLSCGLWHLKICSTDCSMPGKEIRCAFEIMSRDANALPPPLISGLPFLYASRTETRGLITDAFDPWHGASQNAGHYIACANFLPAAVRKYDVFPTVHAYGRENFLWVGSRCLDDWKMEHNMDLIEKADYVNLVEELGQTNLVRGMTYVGFVLEKLIEFAEKNDPDGFDIPLLKTLLKDGKTIDMESLRYLAENHWEAWLDFINIEAAERAKKVLAGIRKKNPKLKYSQYGPAHIYAGFLKGPEFIRMLQCEHTDNDWIGFWQYEDYPFSCKYGLEHGVYFLTCCLMSLPEPRIYPEIYTGGGISGCPDGAVFYAHPPFGRNGGSYPNHIANEILEYCYASGHLKNGTFHYWKNCGFQVCRSTQVWYETLLKTWGLVLDNKPARPVRGTAFVSSESSRRATENRVFYDEDHQTMDVRNTAAEDVPYLYESARKAGLCAGFLLPEQEILSLTPQNTDLLVLPPLKGIPEKLIAHIRKLHEEGVSLIGCEDVSGLEDLFGVADTGKYENVTEIHAAGGFCSGMRDFCDDGSCAGKYRTTSAKVLIEGEIPVLTLQKNTHASAALFNVPPHLVKTDRLHQRFSYGKGGISVLMEKVAAEIMKQLSSGLITTTAGRLMAFYSEKNELCIAVYNPSDFEKIIPTVQLTGELAGKIQIVRCSHSYTELEKGVYRLLLEEGENALFTLTAE